MEGDVYCRVVAATKVLNNVLVLVTGNARGLVATSSYVLEEMN